MNCPTCNARIADGSAFCPACGSPTTPIRVVERPSNLGDPVLEGGALTAPRHEQVSSLAVASLISGIASWVVAPCFGPIAAVICGHMAKSEIKKSAGAVSGDGLATWGLALGYAQLVLGCFAVPVAFLLFGAAILAAIGIQ